MTKYPAWKKREVQRKWHSIIGLFVTIVLVFAVFNGIVKSLSLGKYFGKSSWDGQSSFSAVLDTEPISVFIYNTTKREMTLVRLDESLYVATGDSDNPLSKVSEIIKSAGGQDLAKLASVVSRSPVKNYVMLEDRQNADHESFKIFFKGFASIVTPLNIVVGKGTGFSDTNIARIDMIRLWWQIKSLSVNNLNLVDSSAQAQEIVLADGARILGVDDVSMQRFFNEYMENHKLLEEGINVEVINASGDLAAGQLAADFISSVGGRVASLNQSEDPVEKTTINTAKDSSYTASYLAKLFECDIKALENLEKGQMKVLVGKDFAQRF